VGHRDVDGLAVEHAPRGRDHDARCVGRGRVEERADDGAPAVVADDLELAPRAVRRARSGAGDGRGEQEQRPRRAVVVEADGDRRGAGSVGSGGVLGRVRAEALAGLTVAVRLEAGRRDAHDHALAQVADDVEGSEAVGIERVHRDRRPEARVVDRGVGPRGAAEEHQGGGGHGQRRQRVHVRALTARPGPTSACPRRGAG
jgi:hypothetical protein